MRQTPQEAAGRITDTYLTVSAEEAADARRLGIHADAVAVLNGRDPARFAPDPAAREARVAGWRDAVRRTLSS